MGILSRLFGSTKAGEELVSGAVSAVDKIWYTEEEKAEDEAQARREISAVYMEWLKSTSGSRLARRGIAFIVVGVWAIEHIAGVALTTASNFANDLGVITATKLSDSGQYLTETAFENNTLVGVVLLFYFGGPVASDAVSGLVKKWVGK